MLHRLNLTLSHDELAARGVEVFIYQADLKHQSAPGNKWHKLKFNIDEAKHQQATEIISFGGPYSNHIHALGLTCKQHNLKPIGIIRGELQPKLTPTLKDFIACGGELWPCIRSDYKQGFNSNTVELIKKLYPNAYWVPEGGSNSLGVLGCDDWATSIINNTNLLDIKPNLWAVAAGTGATCAGFLSNDRTPDILVFPALKGGENLLDSIHFFALSNNPKSKLNKLKIIPNYHFGGYAKFPVELKEYIDQIHLLNPDLELDPIYTSKLVYGLEHEIRLGLIKNKCILVVHTGGLQGWSGFTQTA